MNNKHSFCKELLKSFNGKKIDVCVLSQGKLGANESFFVEEKNGDFKWTGTACCKYHARYEALEYYNDTVVKDNEYERNNV